MAAVRFERRAAIRDDAVQAHQDMGPRLSCPPPQHPRDGMTASGEGCATPRLSAKHVIGGRGDMSREQTRFASFFEEMGLERGKERSGVGGVTALLY